MAHFAAREDVAAELVLAAGEPDYKPTYSVICAPVTPPAIRARFGPG